MVVGRLAAESEGDPELRFLDGGTLSFTLAVPIEECERLIVVDAAVLGEPPGSVRVFEGEAMDRQLSRHAKSVHEVSLADLMDMARLTGRLPQRRALIGIEPALVDWGDGLTRRSRRRCHWRWRRCAGYSPNGTGHPARQPPRTQFKITVLTQRTHGRSGAAGVPPAGGPEARGPKTATQRLLLIPHVAHRPRQSPRRSKGYFKDR